MNDVVWQPSEQIIKQANISRFMKRHEIKTYDELIRRSTSGIEWFWDACLHETGVSWFEPYTELLNLDHGVPFARWFLGGRINITHNCVDRHALNSKTANKTALIWYGECGAVKKLTYLELFHETNRVANYLKSQGVGKGDCVALYLPMITELLPIYFAILKIGAICVPIFSGYGTDAVLQRLNHAAVKVVFTTDATLRRGQTVRTKENLDECLNKVPSLKKCVVVRRLFLDEVPMTAGRDIFYDEAIDLQLIECSTEELKSEDECMILYTSGTTGQPKGTVHTHAGVLAQVTKELYFNFDLKPMDVFSWITDIGWMMGPWEIIGTTHFAATLVIMEGAPNFPANDRVFKIAVKENVTHLGVSPTLIRLLRRESADQLAKMKLPSLRIMGSTGEPWDPDSYLWCFKTIGKSNVPIINISGGTELMGCLLAPLIIKELKACSLQGPGLGMAVDIYNESGYPAAENEVGYLVCRKPAPSMTKGFWKDRERYLETYFSKFNNVWNHGDWVMRDADGHWFIRGRADDTIKVAGKRTGSGEIESSLCAHPFVSEACAIGVPDALKGESVACFVVLKQGIGVTDYLLSDIRNLVSEMLGKTLRPAYLHVVTALPKTRSGKIVRSTVRKHFLGQDLGDLSSVENPSVLNVFPVREGTLE